MSHKIKSKLSGMSARAKKMLLLRIYMYAIASGNRKLLSYFGKVSSRRKGRKSKKHKGKKHRKGHKLHGAAKAAFLRRMAAGRRKARR